MACSINCRLCKNCTKFSINQFIINRSMDCPKKLAAMVCILNYNCKEYYINSVNGDCQRIQIFEFNLFTVENRKK